MADIRTMKLNLLADINNFVSGMNAADNEAKGLKNKLGKYSKAMAKSFALAGVAAAAFAVKIGIDGVKAAIDDEQSQKLLAVALQNTTGATAEVIASTEKYIGKQQILFGVADSKLRPALANLARATGDVGEAQKLTNLALDIAAATGKDLETVSLTLAKAYNGNFGALTKLGIPLDENINKSKDFNLVQEELTRLFGGAAKANTETYAGQLAIVGQRFDELKEGIGFRLLPMLKTLLEETNKVAQGFAGDQSDSLSERARELGASVGDEGAFSLGQQLARTADAFSRLFAEITSDDAENAPSVLQSLANGINAVANAINAITNAYSAAKRVGGGVLDFLIINPGEGPKFADSSLGKRLGYKNMAAGGSVMGGQAFRVGEFGPEMFVPSGSGSIRKDTGGGGGNTFILNGIIDAESARRSIERILQQSSRRTGAINLVGGTL